MLPELTRKALAELAGTAGLVCAVVGSGIAAQRLSPGDVGLQLLENSIATALALAALILAFAGTSGAHFNPVVTAVDLARGRLPAREAGVYLLAQFAGGAGGAILANAMFGLAPVAMAARERTGTGLWLSEVVATFGLLVVIHGTLATRPRAIPLAVSAYVGAAYWFTASTAFANPAVTLARTLSDSFAGIAPASVPGFVLAQALGAGLAFAFLAALLPGGGRRRPGGIDAVKPRVLFVCVHNAGRSQIAAAFARQLGQGRVEVLSAGSAPAAAIHENVKTAMAEVGLDLAQESPKLLSDASVRSADAVITMGCGDACPVHPGKRYEDWKVDDPAGKGLDDVRRVRDAIRVRVAALLRELLPRGGT